MGLKCGLNRNPTTWAISKYIGQLNNTDESIFEVVVGWWDDYQSGDLTEWFRENTLNCLRKEKYKLININPYAEKMFDVEDENGNIIDRINDKIY